MASLRFCAPKVTDAAHEDESNDEQTYHANRDYVSLPRKRIDDNFWINFADESVAHVAVVKLNSLVNESCASFKEVVILNPDMFRVPEKQQEFMNLEKMLNNTSFTSNAAFAAEDKPKAETYHRE